MKALIESAFLMHDGKIFRAYIPIQFSNDGYRPYAIDGVYRHTLNANIIVDLTNRRYIKHRTAFPIPEVVSEEVLAVLKTAPLVEYDALLEQERTWRF